MCIIWHARICQLDALNDCNTLQGSAHRKTLDRVLPASLNEINLGIC